MCNNPHIPNVGDSRTGFVWFFECLWSVQARDKPQLSLDESARSQPGLNHTPLARMNSRNSILSVGKFRLYLCKLINKYSKILGIRNFGFVTHRSARCVLDIMDSTSPIAGPDPFQNDPMTSSPSQYSTHPPQTFNPSALQPTNDSSQEHPQHPSQAEDVHPFPGQAPPRQRMPHSQYYIMFSVTGIERSNVKNPIIRFDAKVPPLRFLTFLQPDANV